MRRTYFLAAGIITGIACPSIFSAEWWKPAMVLIMAVTMFGLGEIEGRKQ